jgi:predicted dehydrogenase
VRSKIRLAVVGGGFIAGAHDVASPVDSPLATFRDGWRNCRLMDAILESSRKGSWVQVAKT